MEENEVLNVILINGGDQIILQKAAEIPERKKAKYATTKQKRPETIVTLNVSYYSDSSLCPFMRNSKGIKVFHYFNFQSS